MGSSSQWGSIIASAQKAKGKYLGMSFWCSTLVISNSKGLSEILRDIRSSTYQICRIEEKIIRTTSFNKYICNWTLEVRYIENIVEKSRNCSLGAISPLFHNIFFLPVARFSCLGRGQIFTSRYAVIEISEVEITRVNYIMIWWVLDPIYSIIRSEVECIH